MTLTSLTLTNFRQFGLLKLNFDQPWTIIIAPNAGGKSTILEALHMLSYGESPWESNHTHIIRIQRRNPDDSEYTKLTQSTSRIEADIASGDSEKNLALSFNTQNSVTTKQYFVDGKSTTRNLFLSCFQTVLFSPDLIDILMFEPAQRRSFLDFYTSYLFPEVRDIVSNYSKVLRHRNSILKSIAAQRYQRMFGEKNLDESQNFPASTVTNGNGSMLDYWTTQLIDLGSRIIEARLRLIETLSAKGKLYPTTITYLPTVPLTALSKQSNLAHIKDAFFNRIMSIKEKEKLAGKTLAGPHRDDWHLSVCEQNINRYGSRGEKRMAIADIVFKLNAIFRDTFDTLPILLLDDISSELDKNNIGIVYKKKLSTKQQTIITATSIDDVPKHIRKSVHVITL